MTDHLSQDVSRVFRHLASARMLLAELTAAPKNQARHTELAGHLLLAAGGLAAVHPEMANFIREFQ